MSNSEIEDQYRKLKQELDEHSSISGNGGVGFEQTASIIALGEDVIPLILQDLQKEPSHGLVYILARLTSEQPYENEYLGKIVPMTAGWLQWGRARKYI